ncbi:hypothetical protein [Pseudofrankia saprophytica]|nr:hypothetical protein [Pseudofrankia saprophytica]
MDVLLDLPFVNGSPAVFQEEIGYAYQATFEGFLRAEGAAPRSL